MATVICPNCGGENNITNKDGQECAYCGTLLHLPTSKQSLTKKTVSNKESKKLSETKYIVPITPQYSTKEGVENALKAYLAVQDDVPADIFDYLELKTVKWVYLPMWRYNGNISTEWSCDEVVYRKRKIEEKPIYDNKGNFVRMDAIFETYEDYLPKSGHGQTSFDILVPAIKNIKEELPYWSIDFHTVSKYSIKQLKEEISPFSTSASIRKATIDVDSEVVLTDVATKLKHKAEECSYGNFIPRSSKLPHSVIAGRECVHEHLDFKYKLNEDGTIGELYYIPFVYVAYSYKNDTYAWGFRLNPENNGVYDTPTELDNLVEDNISNQKELSLQIQQKWYQFLFLSGLLSFLVGMIIFLIRNYSLYERIGKRYQNQEYMHSLLGLYKRRDNLLKHGADKKTIADIDAKIKEEYFDEDEEEEDDDETENDIFKSDNGYDEDDKTPKSIAEINQYFAKTEVLKQKLLKRMRRFWLWYISLIIIVGGSILGYALYDNWQSERRRKEEIAAIEVEKRRFYDTISQKFNAEFVGNSYEGGTLSSFHKGWMKIKFLTKSKLQYQIGVGSGEYDFSNGFEEKIKWQQPKTVEYNLTIGSVSQKYGNESTATCSIMFDGYTSKNIIQEYGNEFLNEIIILPKEGATLTNEDYHLEKK